MDISDLPYDAPYGEATREAREPQAGEIHNPTIDDCDRCQAITEVHWLGPNGGVIALCVNGEACLERRRNAVAAAEQRAAQDAIGDEHDTRALPVKPTGRHP